MLTTEKEYIAKLSDLLTILANFWKTVKFHHHIRLWYRGQSDESWELKPGVYRDEFHVNNEQERLTKEQQLMQDFKVQSASLLAGKTSDEDLYFLQQHYKMPTRLLDWSYTPLTALYFAVTETPNKDGALYMMDAYQLATTQHAEADTANGFRGTPTSSFPRFITALQTITHWKTMDNFPKYILPVRPYLTDKRLVLQKSCFTFHVPGKDTLTTAHNSTVKKYLIPKSAKPGIKKELSLLGINDFTTYGDMESLAKTLIANHDRSI